jgi:branched-chain amino acid transport system permease protein
VQQFINYFASGLTSAAIYAIAATGLVLTYTTTGVFNFAHGAMGMVAAFTYWEMRFGWHWPAPIALAVCLLVLAPAFGALLEIVIMRRLEGTSETTKLVVTLSLLLALLGLSLWIWDPNKARPFPKFWEGKVVTVLHVRLPYHQVTALVIALLVALGLRLFLYRTRTGVAMRAAVDDRPLAMLNGARPAVSGMLAWAIGCSLAAIAGILIAPTLTLSALPLTLLIVDSYAAAMIGRLRSLPMTFVGALILGLANDFGRGYLTKITVGQQYIQGFLDSIPVILLFIVLLILPQVRLRGHRALRTREIAKMPTWRGSILFGAVIIVGAAMLTAVLSKANVVNAASTWGFAIIGLSMIPLIGFSGQISLCQLSLAGIGMVVVAHAGPRGNPIAILWAVLITALVGAIIALPALRLSGIYLALSTAAFAVMMDLWIFPLPKFTIFGHRFDLFQAGSLTVKRPRFFGLSIEGPKVYFVFGAACFALVALVVVWVRRSNFGQRLIAMKDSPAACATLGLNLTFTKLAVFTLSAGMAGLGGALYGGAIRTADAGLLQFFTGLTILMVMVIGGINTIGSALFAGIFLGTPILANLFPSLKELPLVLAGGAGIGLGKNPNGFIVNDIRPKWDVFLQEPLALIGVMAAMVLVWVLRVAHLIDNWPYAIASLAILAIAPTVAAAIHKRHTATAGAAAARGATIKAGTALAAADGHRHPDYVAAGTDGSANGEAALAGAATGNGDGDGNGYQLSGPAEWLGVTQPFQPEDVEIMDEVLGLAVLPEVAPRGAS